MSNSATQWGCLNAPKRALLLHGLTMCSSSFLADTELECEKTTKGAETPPAEESPSDNKCGAEEDMAINRHVLTPEADKLQVVSRWEAC